RPGAANRQHLAVAGGGDEHRRARLQDLVWIARLGKGPECAAHAVVGEHATWVAVLRRSLGGDQQRSAGPGREPERRYRERQARSMGSSSGDELRALIVRRPQRSSNARDSKSMAGRMRRAVELVDLAAGTRDGHLARWVDRDRGRSLRPGVAREPAAARGVELIHRGAVEQGDEQAVLLEKQPERRT